LKRSSNLALSHGGYRFLELSRLSSVAKDQKQSRAHHVIPNFSEMEDEEDEEDEKITKYISRVQRISM
jgi:hypothetical protein